MGRGSPERKMIQMGEIPDHGKWHPVAIELEKLGEHKNSPLLSISYRSNKFSSSGKPVHDFRGARLESGLYRVPKGILSAQNKQLLERYLKEGLSETDTEALRGDFLLKHAISPELKELRECRLVSFEFRIYKVNLH